MDGTTLPTKGRALRFEAVRQTPDQPHLLEHVYDLHDSDAAAFIHAAAAMAYGPDKDQHVVTIDESVAYYEGSPPESRPGTPTDASQAAPFEPKPKLRTSVDVAKLVKVLADEGITVRRSSDLHRRVWCAGRRAR